MRECYNNHEPIMHDFANCPLCVVMAEVERLSDKVEELESLVKVQENTINNLNKNLENLNHL